MKGGIQDVFVFTVCFTDTPFDPVPCNGVVKIPALDVDQDLDWSRLTGGGYHPVNANGIYRKMISFAEQGMDKGTIAQSFRLVKRLNAVWAIYGQLPIIFSCCFFPGILQWPWSLKVLFL
jgi:hypothetical protein